MLNAYILPCDSIYFRFEIKSAQNEPNKQTYQFPKGPNRKKNMAKFITVFDRLISVPYNGNGSRSVEKKAEKKKQFTHIGYWVQW